MKIGIKDFHSHILPEIDDGSASVEESVLMLQTIAAQGIDHVIATPHFYAGHNTPERFFQKRNEAEKALREKMAEFPHLPTLSVGAEVYFFDGISNAEILPELAIKGTKAILIEMPVAPWSERNLSELNEIYENRGLIPIIAHIDRYIRPFRTKKIADVFVDLPVLVQANADFFLQKKTRCLALRLLSENKIHLLGSDCHNLKTRPPNLGVALEAINRSLGASSLEQIARYGEDLF